MAKRLSDTNKWNDAWFEDLNNEAKLMFFYYLDHCDCAGVWKGSFKQFNYFTGFNYSKDKFLKDFNEKVIELSNGSFFMPNFIKFQYGPLKPNGNAHKGVNNAHIGVLKSLKYNNIDSSPYLAPHKGLDRGLQALMDKDKNKDKDMDKDKEKEKEEIYIAQKNISEKPKKKNSKDSDIQKEQELANYEAWLRENLNFENEETYGFVLRANRNAIEKLLNVFRPEDLAFQIEACFEYDSNRPSSKRLKKFTTKAIQTWIRNSYDWGKIQTAKELKPMWQINKEISDGTSEYIIPFDGVVEYDLSEEDLA